MKINVRINQELIHKAKVRKDKSDEWRDVSMKIDAFKPFFRELSKWGIDRCWS